MRRSVPVAEPSPTPYFHGTRALAAVCISIDGFRLLPTTLRRWGYGAIGNGIYLTTLLETASYFAGHIGGAVTLLERFPTESAIIGHDGVTRFRQCGV